MKELLVFHADLEYLEDVKSLQRYLHSELNVRDVVFTSDEDYAGIRYRAVADWPVLGRKLRQNVGKVKNALPSVSSAEIKAYTQTGQITVAGIPLVTGDLAIQRYIELPDGTEQRFATQTDNDVVVRLDILVHAELFGEWIAREIINRVQKLRKKAGLKATDDVRAFYEFPSDEGAEVKQAIATHADTIAKACRNVPEDVAHMNGGHVLIAEEHEVSEWKFTLSLVGDKESAENA